MTARRQKPEPQEGQVTAGELLDSKATPAAKPRAREDWQRPPFEPGNTLAVTHGAYSATEIEKRAEEIWPVLWERIQAAPGFMPVDVILARQLRKVCAAIDLMESRNDEIGFLTALDEPQKFAWLLEKYYRQQGKLCEQMGIGSTARMKIFGQGMAASRQHAEALAAQARIRASLKKPRGKRGSK
jgi:hypothetical protein